MSVTMKHACMWCKRMLTSQAAASVPMPGSTLHDYGALSDALQSHIADPLLQTPQLCCASRCSFALADASAISSYHVSVTLQRA